jgi:RND superfamily putative drug exporter
MSARHPWRTIGVWVLVLAVALALNSTLLQDTLTTEFAITNNPDTKRADDLLEKRLRGPKMLREVVLVQSETLTVDDQAYEDRVLSLYDAITSVRDKAGDRVIEGGSHYYESKSPFLVSEDKRTTMLPFTMAGTLDEATKNIEEPLDIVQEANGKNGFRVLIAGDASVAFESNELSVKDIEQGERFGVPGALIILLVLFGAVLAAFIPIVLAIVAIVVALGATALVGQAIDLIFFVTLMITMIGLAVGIDYSLIIVSRFREELSGGLTRGDAIARTGATASRTVFFSGVIVVVALGGMLIIPSNIFQALAVGAILVVMSAVMASLTLLPAVLYLMGDRINALRVPFFGRSLGQKAGPKSGGFWDWVTRTVMRYPLVSLVIVAGLLIAAAVSYFDIKTGFNGIDAFPEDSQAREAFFVLEEEFSFGVLNPAEIVIDGDADAESVLAGIDELKNALRSDAAFVGEPTVQVNDSRDLTLVSVPVAGEVSSKQAVDAIRRLRNTHIPAAFAGVPAEVLVTGWTAFNVDFFDMADRFMPIVFAFVLSLSFVLLTFVFRSIVVPIKAIIMNLLSVGAAYGLMVLVFQKGYGAGILGFQQSEIIDAWIPLFLFSVLFGLSMDYHVFLLSRIRERYDQTGDNTEAVAYGLRTTAGLITGAALIMVAVFSGFASGDLVSNQQVGFGLAVAVFLDATVVRSILVPASMRLLGDINWYLPAVLDWLPDLRVEAEEPATAPASSD